MTRALIILAVVAAALHLPLADRHCALVYETHDQDAVALACQGYFRLVGWPP